MAGTRYSKTRRAKAQHTVATKLTWEEKRALHYIAVERGLSDYEFTRRVIIAGISSDKPAQRIENHPIDSALNIEDVTPMSTSSKKLYNHTATNQG